MCADYVFYSEIFKGALPQANFDAVAPRAAAQLTVITRGRLHQERYSTNEFVVQCAKMAHCALCEIESAIEVQKQSGGAVSSETVGKWRKEYAKDARPLAQQRFDAVASYLPASTGLLYAGVEL